MIKKILWVLTFFLIFGTVFSTVQKEIVAFENIPNMSERTGFPDGSWQRRLLPENFMPDERNDVAFGIFLFMVFGSLTVAWLMRKKVYGKKLGEYVKPLRFYLLTGFLTACSQYITLELSNLGFIPLQEFSTIIQATQLLWALIVVTAVYAIVKKGFKFRQVLFAGLLFDVSIMVTKVCIRYFFYAKTIFYVVDRMLYGTVLVMLVVVASGLGFIYLKVGMENI